MKHLAPRPAHQMSAPPRSKTPEAVLATVGPRAVPQPNHRQAGARSFDVASVVEQGRRAPRVRPRVVDYVAAALGIPPGALEVHAGDAARGACDRIGARAFAVQNVVVLADEAPSPRRVRHELAHVVQQGGARSPAPSAYETGSLLLAGAASRAECEAAEVARGAPASRLGTTGVQVCRDDGATDDDSGEEPQPAEGTAAPPEMSKVKKRLIEYANSKPLGTYDPGDGKDRPDATLFGISNGKSGRDEEFDPVFLESWPGTWGSNDYEKASGVRSDVSRIFRRINNKTKIAPDAVSATAFTIAGGKTVWAVRVIPKGAAPTDDPTTQTWRYTFVGKYLKEAAPIAAGAQSGAAAKITPNAGDALPFLLVNDKVGKPRKQTEVSVKLVDYANIIDKLVEVARKKGKSLDGADPKKAIAASIAVLPTLPTREAKDEEASKARHLLEEWILKNYDEKIDELYDQVIASRVFDKYYAIQASVWNGFLQRQGQKAGVSALQKGEIRFGEPKSGKDLRGMKRADGLIKAADGDHILEGKARTAAPDDREKDQMVYYKEVISGKVRGYMIGLEPVIYYTFTAVEYFVGSDLKIAEVWDNELSAAFNKHPKVDNGYRIHPNPKKDPEKEVSIQINPVVTLRIPKPEQLDQSVENVKTKLPGVTIKNAEFKLARPREADIASGTILVALDLKGAVKSAVDDKPKPITIIPITEAKPAKPGGPIVHGRINNEFKKLDSALSKLLKRLKYDAKVTETGIEAWILVTPDESPVKYVRLEETKIRATLKGTAPPTMSGKLGLSSKKVTSNIQVTWDNELRVAGTVTFKDIVDGLKPIVASFTYDDATGIRIFAKQPVGIKKELGGVTLTGSASDLRLDPKLGEFSGNATITAHLGAFGKATAGATIAANQISRAEFKYQTDFKSAKGALQGKIKGVVSYTAPKEPTGAATFDGGVNVEAEIAAAPLKKLSKGGKLGIEGSITVAKTGALRGTIGTTTPLRLGKHFSIPKIEGAVADGGGMSMDFTIEVVDVGPLKNAKAEARIDEDGFHLGPVGAKLDFHFGEGPRVWGSIGIIYLAEGKDAGLTVGGTLNLRIKDDLVVTGRATYNTQTEEVDASLEAGEVTLLHYGPKPHTIFRIPDTQIDLISFLHIIGLYLDVGFELGFEYYFDLRLKPKVKLKGLSLKTFSFESAEAKIMLLGELSASLIGTPTFGLGIFVISTRLLRGGGGLKVPITGKASLALDNTVVVTYTPEGGISAGGTTGLTLLFGVAGDVEVYAKLSVLGGAYEPTWNDKLTSFTIMKPRPVFTYVVDFGKPLTKDEKPEIPSGETAPAKPSASTNHEGKPAGGKKEMPIEQRPVKEQEPEKKHEAKNQRGFDLMGLVSGLLDGPSFKAIKPILDAAADVYKAISGYVSQIVSFIRNLVGGVIDDIVKVLRMIKQAGGGEGGIFVALKGFLRDRLHPAVFFIVEPLLDQLKQVEQNMWDLLETKLPPSLGGMISWALTLAKKILKLAWDSLGAMISGLRQVMSRAVDQAGKFLEQLVRAGRLGVRRHARYLGFEGTWAEYDFMMADEYKVIDVGGLTLGPTRDDTPWPVPEKAIGWGIYELLREFGVPATSTAINGDTHEPYNDYWVERVERLAQGKPTKRARSRLRERDLRDAADAGDAIPLPQPMRERYEAAFGTSLADVRLHTSASSARAADALDAHAYAVGRHIHFGAGAYAPGTAEGERLLAHELSHAAWTPQASWKRYGDHVSDPRDTSERRAVAAAEHAMTTLRSSAAGGHRGSEPIEPTTRNGLPRG